MYLSGLKGEIKIMKQMNEKEIIEYLNNKKQVFNTNPNRFKKEAKEFLDEFSKKINLDLEKYDYKILFYLWKENLKEIPKCQYKGCDNEARFLNLKEGFSKGCCHEHAKKVTFLEKYGSENAFASKEIQKKVSKTFKEKYGVSHLIGSPHFKEKMKEKYGVEKAMDSEELKEKSKQKMKEKYGGVGAASKEIRKKMEETTQKRYGVKNVLVQYSNSHIDNIDDWNDKQFIEENFVIDSVPKIQEMIEYFNCSNLGGNLYKHLRKLGIELKVEQSSSYAEKEISNFIKELGFEVKENFKPGWLNGKELDIVIPSKKIAIEFNGLYWHSELNDKGKNYHLNKTRECEKNGYQLIHIFEDEWLFKKEIVKSVLKSKLGIFDRRIYARKTKIREIDYQTTSDFLEENHLQGKDNSKIRLGLYHNDELVSVMTFGRPRFNNNYQYEMHRFCSKIGYQIIGGASKLFRYFTKIYNPNSVVTYADRRYSKGETYPKLGFTLKSISKPNFFVMKDYTKREHRMGYQKHKQKNILKKFDPELTAWQNLQLNGYDRIWDCGNYVFEWRKED